MTTGYSARNESIKLSILLTCLCLSILYGDWVWRWDRLIYDVQSSMIKHKASDDIVIIAIDETSLHSIGRWPWPRNIHAKLIDKLTQYQAKAIIIDVIFSESTPDKHSDQLLTQAIERNGHVVLPVLLEQTRLRGHLLETLPLPELTQAAASIGHVHVELDPDGIARGTYLYEGLGEAHWPHIGMSVLKIINEVDDSYNTPKTTNSNKFNKPWTWIRKQHFLIPFIGPPGSFKTTSYINVLNDQVLAETLKDKIVLVGVTAAGLGDSLPTPVSGLAQPMPGIEINANIVQAIKSNSLVKIINPVFHYFIASVLVMLPILLFPYLSPRIALLIVVSEIVIIYLASLILLHWFYIWIPLSSTFICLLLAYPIWAWRRLEFTVKYLNMELKTLSKEANEIQRYAAQDNDQPFEIIQNLIPINGLTVATMSNKILINLGTPFNIPVHELSDSSWTPISNGINGRKIFISKNTYRAYILWNDKTPPNERQNKIINFYIRQQLIPKPDPAKTTVEIIESRIRDIQATTEKLAYLRHFITDSFEQMADGVIVIDSLGTVTLANRQAAKQISRDSHTPLLHQPIQPILSSLTIATGESWDSIISSLLSNKRYENLQVRTNKNKDLVVNISPLYSADSSLVGFIISLSDITEIKEAQRKRNEMLSFLSHDLRSPLVSVLAMVEQSKIDNPDTDINKKIEHNINHTIKLAEDFVHLSRIEGDDDIQFSSISMSDIIANAIDTVWDQANIKQIEIKQNILVEGWVLGNGAILERVIINLLTNAIKYSHEKCLIKITLNQLDSTIICCIQDNGQGIKQEDIPYLFDRFKRSRETNKKQPGIGLGLAFVHAAIEKHHGTISVTSKTDEGSDFCISLPVET